MKITCHLLLLLASAITSATSQSQDCIEVRNELVNNRECGHAMTTVGLLLRGYDVVIDRRFLNAYCSRSCRNINIRIDHCNPDQVSLNFVCIATVCRVDNRMIFLMAQV